MAGGGVPEMRKRNIRENGLESERMIEIQENCFTLRVHITADRLLSNIIGSKMITCSVSELLIVCREFVVQKCWTSDSSVDESVLQMPRSVQSFFGRGKPHNVGFLSKTHDMAIKN